jgi:hypothetical protein
MAGAALAMASCGVTVGDVRVGPTPFCDTTSRGLLLLMAQAVPSADRVPCLEQLPEGWRLEHATVASGRAELTLDGPGVDVHVTLVASCAPLGEPAAGDGPPGVSVFERRTADAAERQFVFDGGCVVVDAPLRMVVAEMTDEISFVTRATLRSAGDFEL